MQYSAFLLKFLLLFHTRTHTHTHTHTKYQKFSMKHFFLTA